MKKAFVLGAGLGTRLQSLTSVLPKPLIPVLNRPLITYAFDQLRKAGVGEFIVNTHHLPEKFGEVFPEGRYEGCPIHFVHEPVRLETGGGIANIADRVRDDSFLVFNGDILTNLPLDPLIRTHRESENLVTLALRSAGPQLHVAWDQASGKVRDLGAALAQKEGRHFQFTGIYAVHPDFLDYLKAEPESVVPAFLKAIEEEDRVGGVVVDEGYWWDLGTREAYLDATRDLIAKGARGRIHPSAQIEGAEIDEFSSIGPDCEVEAGAKLEQCVLWPGASVAAGAKLERCILTTDAEAAGAHRNEDF